MLKRLIAPFLFLLAVCFAAPASAQQACPDPYSARGACTPVTASATGTTGAITATTVTITGTISGTLNFGFPTLAAAATVPNTLPIDEEFIPCIAASALNTAIVVNGPALGAGSTLTTVTAWGYYL